MEPSKVTKALESICSRLAASKNPDRKLVANSIRGVLRHLATSVEEHFEWLGPIDERTSPSDLLWHAMKNANAKDWMDGTTVEEMIQGIQEIVQEHPYLQPNLARAIKYARQNFDNYQYLVAKGKI